MTFPVMTGTPAQVGDPWAEGDRCIIAKDQLNDPPPPVGIIRDIRYRPASEADYPPRQKWITKVYRALVEWPDGERWHDLDALCIYEEDE